ncbi:tyrosine-type recombinase/integrase [Trichococcus shcherbakoviae]|uniref:tyrosine-type recombinase/integrase n=1 Tax=Trichococcus shcherbakoviae TaxID=2094020 RepID=UPI002AA73358|nr:tyrosine-type recombinase/integrase [Trichococcus shcherbakoviae]
MARDSKIKEYIKKDGSKAYMFQTYLGVDPATGKPRKTTRRGFSTKKEAALSLSRLKFEVEEDGFQKVNHDTFEEIYLLWFDSAYKNTVKESTYVKTKETFRLHILPAFGSMKLNKISVTYCQTTVNNWCDSLAKYRVMKNYVTKVLDYSITLGLLKDNPMRKIIMPRRKEIVDGEKVENFYNKEELQHFLDCIKSDGFARWNALFRLLAFTGFRKGEALALEWKDIDFNQSTVTVNKTLAKGEDNKLIIQSPKTKTSVRTVSVDPGTMQLLKEWRKEQATDFLKLGFNTMNPSQVVFTTYKNDYMQLATVTNRINKIIKKHDLKVITVHGLRHTHCSLLFEAGASIQEVKERLGHSDIKTTMNIYTHVTQQAKEGTAEKFAAYVNF